MSSNDATTVVIRRSEFEEVRGDVKSILERVNNSAIKAESHETRLALVERVVYGGVGLVLLSVGGAVVGLVLIK